MEKMSLWKNRLIYLVQVIIGLGLVIWILAQVDRAKFVGYFFDLNISTLLLILPLSAASLWVQYQRWKYMISNYSENYNTSDLLPSFFAGFTFRLLIPGGHAELSKVLLLPGQKRGKVIAFGMERIFQTMIKILLSVWLLSIHFPQYILVYTAVSILIVGGYIAIPRFSLIKNLHEKPVHYHAVFFWSIVFSAGVYLVMFSQYFLLLKNAFPISLWATAYTVVYIWSAGVIPISISGLGIREGLAVYFLSLYGVPAAYAVATSLFLFALNAILPALIGVIYIYKKRAHLKDVRHSIQSTRDIWRSWYQNKKNINDVRK